MMRSWLYRSARTIAITSVAVSVLTHAAVITAWVLGTMPAPEMPDNSIANRVFYIPPPDRVANEGGSRERVHYVKVDVSGLGTGEGPRMMGEARPTSVDQTVGKTLPEAKDSVTSEELRERVSEDSVYSVLEVDTAVVRSSKSAAPAYPPSLLRAHVEGYVNAQYVVDTTGRADTTTFVVLKATNPEFVTAVKDVLPFMQFESAKIGSTKVRQLVQQQFSFKITDSLPPPKKPPA